MTHIDDILADSKRGSIGYGSVYRRGGVEDMHKSPAIKTVLRGQVWMVKPDHVPDLDPSCLLLQDESSFCEKYNQFEGCRDCEFAPSVRDKLLKVQ